MPSEFEMRAPHPALRPLITRYIGYRQDEVTLEVHRGLPSRHVTLIISLAEPIRVIDPSGRRGPAELPALVGGLHTSSALIAQDRHQCGLHLELNPLGVRELLGMPSAELSGSVVDLSAFGQPDLARLPERLVFATSWQERFGILDAAFLSLRRSVQPGPPEVDWAWRRLVEVGGKVPVQALADEVGWSRRHFAERFRREVGLAPKQAARVVRFERACAALRRAPATDLSELAVACGYYDQPHLTNEWRALAGCSPGTWVAEELPVLSDDGPRDGELTA